MRDRRAHHEQVVLGLAPSPVAARPLATMPVPAPAPLLVVAVAVRLVRVSARVRGQGLGLEGRVSAAALASTFSRYREM